MKRWISSICITLALMVTAFFLPLWAEQDYEPRESILGEMEETARISTVNFVQRQVVKPVAKAQPAPIIPPDFPTVASHKEEDIEEEPEEPEEIQETTEEFSEEMAEEQAEGEMMASPPARQGNFGQGNSQKQADPEYRQYVLQRIASKKIYPRGARSKEQEGVVRLSITISPDGKLLESKVVAPSEHSLLNEASLLAVKKAAPFKRMPPGMEELNLTFSIDYSLQ